MRHLALFFLSLWFFCTPNVAAGQSVLIEAENFTNKGGWVVDQQFMDLMGSPYLMAHGMGFPVEDAAAMVNSAESETKNMTFPEFSYGITYHSYTMRPEDAYTENRVPGLRSVLEKYSKDILLRQGENGAPSTYIPSFALSEYYWTEYTQAKYNMRRMLGDLGHDIETSVFTIIDIYYNWGNRAVLNTKGLIQSDITMAAIRPKVAYYAIQNLAAIFDDNMVLNPEFKYTSTSKESLSVYSYQHQPTKTPLVTLWLDGNNVTNSFETTQVNISFNNITFKTPVWVDLMTGGIYEIPKSEWSKSGDSFTFNIPLYDSPVLITEKSFLTE